MLTLTGCSSDDSDTSNGSNNLFLKINISGTEYNSTGLFATGYGGEENCDSNGDLFLQLVGQVENSEIFVDCSFVHYENTIDFNDDVKNDIQVTRLTDTNDLWELGTGDNACSKTNDFSIVFEDKQTQDYLKLKQNTTATHTITRADLVSEDTQGEQYIIEGNFTATFLNGSTDVPVNGSYRTKIDVLK
jgi:hypothetical protein